MITWFRSGTCLGRDIETARCDSFNCLLTPGSLHGSLLLVVAGATNGDVYPSHFIDSIIVGDPLGIIVYGESARVAFDRIIDKLTPSATTGHVMTNVLPDGSILDAVEILLFGTWPSEERFDEWKKYSILTIGKVSSAVVEDAIKELTTRTKNP